MTVRRVVRFLMAGGVGFVVDFSTMWALLNFARASPIAARAIAFAIAVVFTYVLNRTFTFADRPRRGRAEWIAYAIASGAAALVNLGVFVLALNALGPRPLAPYIAMPIGVAVGLVVNFVCYNFVVFRAAPTKAR